MKLARRSTRTMRYLSVTFLTAIVASGPTPSLGFVTTRKPVSMPTLASKVEKPLHVPAFVQPRLPLPGTRTRTTSTARNAVNPELLTSFLPPAMGFVKTEWTVSYGYGFSVALSALLLLSKQPQQWTFSTLHAAALVFYGLRLNLFLFLRNRFSPRYREIGKTIDERSKEKFPTLLSRAPFVLSCGLLFYGLYIPAMFTSKLASDTIAMKTAAGLGLSVMKALIGIQWLGITIAAIGDLTKSYVKASEKDGKFLVTSGVFSMFRHPNFSGEILAWTCNALCGALSAAYLLRSRFSLSTLGYLGLSTMGWSSMVFVLLRATSSLEERQQKEYGGTEKYEKWVKGTWSGWKLPVKKEDAKTEELPQITLNADSEEDFGSGI